MATLKDESVMGTISFALTINSEIGMIAEEFQGAESEKFSVGRCFGAMMVYS